MVKFTKQQIEFLKTQFLFNEVELQEKALDFVPMKKRNVKEVPSEDRCCATKKDGEQCTKKKTEGTEMCSIHNRNPPKDAPVKIVIDKHPCRGTTKKNEQCKKNAIVNSNYCSIHSVSDAMVKELASVVV